MASYLLAAAATATATTAAAGILFVTRPIPVVYAQLTHHNTDPDLRDVPGVTPYAVICLRNHGLARMHIQAVEVVSTSNPSNVRLAEQFFPQHLVNNNCYNFDGDVGVR
jgi:hypothetical protein